MPAITHQLELILTVETIAHQIIKQTPDDKSRYGNFTFFGDIKDLPLRRASLVGKGHIFTIDLIDGHAEFDGHQLYPPKAPPISLTNPLKLIYYRQVQQGLQTGPTGDKVLVPVVRYFIGWEVNNGKHNINWTMGVN